MTEKRFAKLLEKEFMLYDNLEKKQIISYDEVVDLLNTQDKKINELKKELFEAKVEGLWYASDEVDRVLYFEDEVKEIKEEINNKW